MLDHLPNILILLIQTFLCSHNRVRNQRICKTWFQAQRSNRMKEAQNIVDVRLVTKKPNMFEGYLWSEIRVFKKVFYLDGQVYDFAGKKQENKLEVLHPVAISDLYICSVENKIYQPGLSKIQILSHNGELKYHFQVPKIFEIFAINDRFLFGVRGPKVFRYDFNGQLLNSWRMRSEKKDFLKVHVWDKKQLILIVTEKVVDIYDLDGHFVKNWDIVLFGGPDMACFSDTHIFFQDFHRLIVYDFDGNLAFKTPLRYRFSSDMFYLDGHLCGLDERNLISYRVVWQ